MQRLMLFVLVSFLLAGAVTAQTSQDSWDNLKQLQAGQKIQVVDMKLKSFEGKLIEVTDEAISLLAKEGEVTVERESVARVSAKGQGHRLRNTILGTLIGGAIGGSIAAVNTRSWIEWQEATAVAVGFGGGAAVGGVLPTSGWKVVYRRR